MTAPHPHPEARPPLAPPPAHRLTHRPFSRRFARLFGGSLRARLVASAVLFVLVAIPLTGLVLAHVLEGIVRAEVATRLDLQLSTLRAALTQDDPRPRPGRPSGDAKPGRDNSFDRFGPEPPPFDRPGSGWYWRILVDGREMASSRSLGPRSLDMPDPEDEDGPPHRLRPAQDEDGQELLVRSLRFEREGENIRIDVTAPRGALSAPLRDAILAVALTLAGLGLLLIGAIVFQVRFGLLPLEHLRGALKAVREGRRERIEGPQPAELKPLVDELNALIAQDAAHLRQARLHVANLAHGLKTPLATLSAAAERLDAGERQAEMLGLLDLMDRRIRHHLRRARTAALGGTRRQADVARHGRDLAAMLDKFRENEAVRIEARLPETLPAGVDGEDLDEMLGNLLDNARRHARSLVTFDAGSQGREVLIRIGDDGLGLSEAEIATVRQPGRRLDESQPGHGFGIPITAEIAELYGGRLEFGRAGEGGLEARLVLPAATVE